MQRDQPVSVGKLRVCNFYLQPQNVSPSFVIPALLSLKHDHSSPKLKAEIHVLTHLMDPWLLPLTPVLLQLF